LDAASRAEHPIVSALVANALAGPDAYKLLGALQQREEARQATMAAASEKRFEYGRNLALKMGDVAPLDPSDPLRPQFEKAFGAMATAKPPEGYQHKPPGSWIKKLTPPPHRPVAGEGGIFDVGPGEGGGLEARPIPVLPPLGAPPPTPQGAPGAITKPMPIPSPTGKERPQPIQPSRGRAPIQPIPTHEPTGAGLFLKPIPRAAAGAASEGNVTLKEVEGGKIAKYDKKGNFMGYAEGPGGGTQFAKISDQDKQKAEAIEQVESNINAAEKLLTGMVQSGEMFRGAKASAAHWLPQTVTESFPSLDQYTAYEGLRQDIGAGLRPLVGVQNMRNIQEIDRILKNVATSAASPERIAFAFQRVRSMVGAAKQAFLSTRPQIANYLSARRGTVEPQAPPPPEPAPGRIDLLTAQAHKRALELQRQKRGGQ